MSASLKGRVAVITGASRGIGKACALRLAQEGCHIVIAAKTVEPDPRLPGTIYDAAREVEQYGVEALAMQTNVRNEDEIERLAEAALHRFGQVDILVNNAGALWWQPVTETPPNRFDLVMDVNVRASFLCARAFLPSMIENKWGHIVNMSPPIDMSVISQRTAYMISKFGMTMMVFGLAEEVKQHNIAANALWPATIIESQASINYQLGQPKDWRKPEIVADALAAMVSKPPSHRTGTALIDEDVLREEGATDFEKYNCVPGSDPPRLTWSAVQ